jgi:hypothetical protein
MTGAPIAHVGGIPIEETLGSLGPALLAGLGVAWAKLRSRLGRGRAHTSSHASPRNTAARSAKTGQAGWPSASCGGPDSPPTSIGLRGSWAHSSQPPS